MGVKFTLPDLNALLRVHLLSGDTARGQEVLALMKEQDMEPDEFVSLFIPFHFFLSFFFLTSYFLSFYFLLLLFFLLLLLLIFLLSFLFFSFD